MKWAALSLAMLATAASSGCWRPYYGQQYAAPVYPQAPVMQPAPAYQQAAPVYQQAPVMQGCAPACQPACTPCY